MATNTFQVDISLDEEKYYINGTEVHISYQLIIKNFLREIRQVQIITSLHHQSVYFHRQLSS